MTSCYSHHNRYEPPTGQTQTMFHRRESPLLTWSSMTLAQTAWQTPNRVLRNTVTQSLRGTSEAQGGRNEKAVSPSSLTGEDEDEEGADASDHADDLADVWDKHGDDQRGDEPQYRQNVAAAVLQLRRRPAAAPSPAAQQRLLDH